jgi:hypothetical protein
MIAAMPLTLPRDSGDEHQPRPVKALVMAAPPGS